MKKISLLLFVLQFSLNCMSQQLSNVVDFKLPAGSEKADDKPLEIQSTGSKKLSLNLPYKDVNYVVDGIQISFHDLHFEKQFQDPLETTMAKPLVPPHMVSPYTNVKSFIKTYNNIRFLISSYDDFNGKSFLMFNSDWHNDRKIIGILEFNKDDTEKANNIMDAMLGSMKFKD